MTQFVGNSGSKPDLDPLNCPFTELGECTASGWARLVLRDWGRATMADAADAATAASAKAFEALKKSLAAAAVKAADLGNEMAAAEGRAEAAQLKAAEADAAAAAAKEQAAAAAERADKAETNVQIALFDRSKSVGLLTTRGLGLSPCLHTLIRAAVCCLHDVLRT